MRIAVLSGKGGTGKTLVAVNLAAAAKCATTYIDCDVEEPNGHLFLKPEVVQEEEVTVKIPAVNEQLCMGCRTCIYSCRFNALAYVNDKLKIFADVCHCCGGCVLLCPVEALSDIDKVIGKIQKGAKDNINVNTGILDFGVESGVPIIKKLLSEYVPDGKNLTLIDCPPGSACIVMESIKDVDYCILVAEPTVFGVHNLNMVYELVKLFNKPHGVVLNKCLEGENPSEQFCIEKGIKILDRIPFDHELGMINSNARIAARESEKYQKLFVDLLQKVTEEVHQHEAVTHS